MHEEVLLARMEACFRELGGVGRRQYPTGPGRAAGVVDLFVTLGRERIVCEAELTADRAVRDLAKAHTLKATLLIIVVPNTRVAHSIRKRLASVRPRSCTSGPDIWVFPLGVAIQRFMNSGRFRSGRNVPASSGPN